METSEEQHDEETNDDDGEGDKQSSLEAALDAQSIVDAREPRLDRHSERSDQHGIDF